MSTSDPPKKASEPPAPAAPAKPPDDVPSEDAPAAPEKAKPEAPSDEPAPPPPSVEEELEPVRTSPPSKPPPQRGSSRPPADGEGIRPLPPPTRRPTAEHSPAPPAAAAPGQFPPETVADIMTRTLIAAGENDTLESIEIGMKRFRFRHLPVVDGNNKLVGLVTRHDVLSGPPDSLEPEDDEPTHRWDKSTTVGTMMRRDVLTTRPTTPLVQAARALLQKRIGCLPVIEEDNTLVGIVTKADFLKLAIELLERH